MLRSHFDLQKLPGARSAYFIIIFILIIIGVCSVILRCKQSFNMFLSPQPLI